MTPLVECVPNFSEGQRRDVIAQLEATIRQVPGVALLHTQADADHHRSVVTFAGDPEAVFVAAFAAAELAAHRIDLTKHHGQHPRMGSTDVIPFIPLRSISMDDCVQLARRLGHRLAAELSIPVYLYGHAANAVERVWLPRLRGKGFEALLSAARDGVLPPPDIGPYEPHPTSGITAVGARTILVAYNVLLETADVVIAEDIAAQIRESSGGMPSVQARGFLVGGGAQVSTNLLDLDDTKPIDVYEAVETAARKAGNAVRSSEVVGLIPARGISENDAQRMKLGHALVPHVLEHRLAEVGFGDDFAL